MALLDRFFGKSPRSDLQTVQSLETVQKDGSAPDLGPQGWNLLNPSSSLLLGGLNPSHAGIAVGHYSALGSAAVYACVRALAEDVACLPIQIRKKMPKGGLQVDLNHPLVDLLIRPNSFQTTFDFISMIVTNLSLRGNAYVYVKRGPDGSPIMLLPIVNDRITHQVSKIDGSEHFTISHPLFGTGNKKTVSADDMIIVRNIGVSDNYVGENPVAIMQDVFAIDLQGQTFAAKLFSQGTMVSGVVSMLKTLSTEAALRFKQTFTSAYSSNENAHKVALLEEGATFTPFDNDAEKTQLLQSRQFAVEQAARAFGLPPHRIGGMNRVSYSSLESQNQAYIDNTLMPLIRKIEEAFSAKLLFEDEVRRYEIKFDFSSLLRGNTKERFDGYQIALLNGIFNVDEVREREGLPPLPDGLGTLHRFPVNTAPGSDPTAAQPDNAQKDPPDDAGDADAAQEDGGV